MRGAPRVLLVGPDGAGKSSVCKVVRDEAQRRGYDVVGSHYRPNFIAKGLPSQSASASTQPHAAAVHSIARASAKLLVTFADHAVGYAVLARGRRGLHLIERGWWDQVVDPTRYRIPERLEPLVRVLGALLPRADLVIVLACRPEVAYERKPELLLDEYRRQALLWNQVAPRAGRHVVVVPTDGSLSDTEELSRVVVAGALEPSGLLRRIPLTAGRLHLAVTASADTASLAAALSFYRPLTRRARAAYAVARRARRLTLRARLRDPYVDLALGSTARKVDAVCTLHSSWRGRRVAGLVRDGRLDEISKIGPADDAGLTSESSAAAFLGPALSPGPVRIPRVIAARQWATARMINYEYVSGSEPRDACEIVAACVALQSLSPPWVHGDLAPWNVLRDGENVYLLDLELAHPRDEPLYDLAHFVLSQGALLNGFPDSVMLDALTGEDGPGRAVCTALGRSDAPLAARTALLALQEQLSGPRKLAAERLHRFLS